MDGRTVGIFHFAGNFVGSHHHVEHRVERLADLFSRLRLLPGIEVRIVLPDQRPDLWRLDGPNDIVAGHEVAPRGVGQQSCLTEDFTDPVAASGRRCSSRRN